MHLLIAVASLVLGFSPAMAEDGSSYDPNSHERNDSVILQPANHGKYLCETYSKGEKYKAIAHTQEAASASALKACEEGGGKVAQCQANLECRSINDGSPQYPTPHTSSYFDWARGKNGYGYCYEFDVHGKVMHWGRPQPNYLCERVRPSFYDWGQYHGSPYVYCFQWTPYGVVMNEGRPVPNYYCQYKAFP